MYLHFQSSLIDNQRAVRGFDSCCSRVKSKQALRGPWLDEVRELHIALTQYALVTQRSVAFLF
ncbi:Uncharacterised protein [Streptococcus suis]|nr:Uncharacterised protein [Streptococcus suis]